MRSKGHLRLFGLREEDSEGQAGEVQTQSSWETEMREIHVGSAGRTRYAVCLGDQYDHRELKDSVGTGRDRRQKGRAGVMITCGIVCIDCNLTESSNTHVAHTHTHTHNLIALNLSLCSSPCGGRYYYFYAQFLESWKLKFKSLKQLVQGSN